MTWEPRQANAGSFQGNFGPKRGGVNCESRDSRVEEMRSIGIWFVRECLFVFYAEHNNKIERGLGT